MSAVRVRCFKFRNWEKFIKEGPTQGKLDLNSLKENTANAQYWNVAYILTSIDTKNGFLKMISHALLTL